jgi:tetratricopeptide (TPR) repeat protein
MEGDAPVARAAALKTAERTNLPDLMRQPGFASLQHYWMSPWFDRVRFGRWDEITAAPNPAPDLPYVSAIWHYAQGTAAARLGRIDDARRHLAALRPLAADPVMDSMTMWDRYPLSYAARIAERSLTAEVASAEGDNDAAIAALREAVAIEDRIPYDEPPGWHAPVRQALGAQLLVAKRQDEAEQVYREELRRNPSNGWSLLGLAQSLKAQRRAREAAEIERQVAQIWKNADVPPLASKY